jgi:CubicO group peptidase (beta-lactamase class C family)
MCQDCIFLFSLGVPVMLPYRWAVLRSILMSLALISVLLPVAGSAAEPEFSDVTDRMRQFVDDNLISGAVTLVGHQGKIVHLSAVGLADIQQRRPMTSDTMFRIMSMTKPITVTALMILVDKGKLSIEDPVEKFLPVFAEAKLKDGEAVQGLKVRHLLTHTSGLGGNQQCETSLAATADMLAERPFNFQPGTKWEYGPSLNVCGRIIEVVSGQKYEDFLAERIFKPLGMDDTTFFPTDEQRPRVVVSYRRDDDKQSLEPSRNLVIDALREKVPNPSGGLVSTADNMYRFYQMVLNGGELDGHRIVSKEAARAMVTVQTDDLQTGFTRGNGWGLGWCIIRRPSGVTEMLSSGTFGHGGLYGTQGWVDPQRQAIFVLLIQRSDIENSDGSEIREEFQRVAVESLDR